MISFEEPIIKYNSIKAISKIFQFEWNLNVIEFSEWNWIFYNIFIEKIDIQLGMLSLIRKKCWNNCKKKNGFIRSVELIFDFSTDKHACGAIAAYCYRTIFMGILQMVNFEQWIFWAEQYQTHETDISSWKYGQHVFQQVDRLWIRAIDLQRISRRTVRISKYWDVTNCQVLRCFLF